MLVTGESLVESGVPMTVIGVSPGSTDTGGSFGSAAGGASTGAVVRRHRSRRPVRRRCVGVVTCCDVRAAGVVGGVGAVVVGAAVVGGDVGLGVARRTVVDVVGRRSPTIGWVWTACAGRRRLRGVRDARERGHARGETGDGEDDLAAQQLAVQAARLGGRAAEHFGDPLLDRLAVAAERAGERDDVDGAQR